MDGLVSVGLDCQLVSFVFTRSLSIVGCTHSVRQHLCKCWTPPPTPTLPPAKFECTLEPVCSSVLVELFLST